jgi:hypothetical protein
MERKVGMRWLVLASVLGLMSVLGSCRAAIPGLGRGEDERQLIVWTYGSARPGEPGVESVPMGEVRQAEFELHTDSPGLQAVLRNPRGEVVREFPPFEEIPRLFDPSRPTYLTSVAVSRPEDGIWQVEVSGETLTSYRLQVWDSGLDTRLVVETDKPTYRGEEPIQVTARLVRGDEPIGGGTAIGDVSRNMRGMLPQQLVLQETNAGVFEAQFDAVTDRAKATLTVTVTNGLIQRRVEVPLTIQLESAGIIGVQSERVVDTDGDGIAESLEIDVLLDVRRTGQYQLKGWLRGPDRKSVIDLEHYDNTSNAITGVGPEQLMVGQQVVTLAFDGEKIRRGGVAGPYEVDLELQDMDQDGKEVDARQGYVTRSYRADNFEK